MSKIKRDKKEMHLPQNFQEVMISNEILLKKKISDDVIRKLVYLYSVRYILYFHSLLWSTITYREKKTLRFIIKIK